MNDPGRESCNELDTQITSIVCLTVSKHDCWYFTLGRTLKSRLSVKTALRIPYVDVGIHMQTLTCGLLRVTFVFYTATCHMCCVQVSPCDTWEK